ncbi:MAG TPA: glycosylase [Planctomycetaceae bacterium]|nr:glycosylase [Planctomycetaceae bacterium]
MTNLISWLTGVGCVMVAALVTAEDRVQAELTQFEPIAGKPVFVAAGEGHWDARIRERGWVLRDGDQWRMWYTGYDGSRTGLKLLGHATSSDGLRWTRDERNPLYREHWVEDVCVVKHDGTYYMVAEGFLDQAQMLTSPDGLAWKRRGLLDVRRVNGEPISRGAYGTPVLWIENGVWHLFYERSDLGVWLAKSTDLRVWTNVQDAPVLAPGPDLYDRDQIAMNQIVRHKGRYYAVFHGAANDKTQALWATGLAVSDDLVHWTKCPGNPLRPIGENKSSGLLIPHGDGFRLYTMHDRVDVHESKKKD